MYIVITAIAFFVGMAFGIITYSILYFSRGNIDEMQDNESQS